MARKPGLIYMYNPISNTKTPITYEELVELTEQPLYSLRCFLSQKKFLCSLNCYLVNDKFTNKDLRELMNKYNPKNEIWKPIKETNDTYHISNYGRVRRVNKTGYRLMMPYIPNRGRNLLYVSLMINKKPKEFAINRLVADYFVVNDIGDNAKAVHKNGDYTNNHASNIEWITPSEAGKRFGGMARSKPIVKIDLITGEILEDYKNIKEAGEENYISSETIRQALKEPDKRTAAGYKWAYYNESMDNALYNII